MKSIKSLSLFVLFSLASTNLALAASQKPPAEPTSDPQILAMIQEIVLGAEYKSTAPVVSRWTKPATVSVFNATPEEEAIVEHVVNDLNGVLKGTKFYLKLIEPNASDPRMKIIFAPKREFSKIAAQHQFEYFEGNIGFFRIWSNPGFGIFKAVVLVDSKLKKKMKNHIVHEEIVQAIGLAKDSAISSSSIFYETQRDGGKAQTFSPLDRKIIKFFYKYLKPGQGRESVAKEFKRHWHKVSL